MKSKINIKILYLVLALYYLLPFINYTISFFQPLDETGLEKSTTFIVYLLINLTLVLVFGFLYYKTKKESYCLSNLTLIKLTLLFIWFGMQITLTSINVVKLEELIIIINYVLPLMIFLVPLFKIENPKDLDEAHLQISNQERLIQLWTTYEILFNTMLASIIIIDSIEILRTTIAEIISPQRLFSFDTKFFWKFISLKFILIIVAFLIYLVHEKYKKYIVSNVYTFNQIIFTYTALCFFVYFFLNFLIDWIIYGLSPYLEEPYNYVALTIFFAGFVFLYFRKGNRQMIKGESMTHMAFSSLIYCMSFGFILWSMYHKLPYFIDRIFNSYGNTSQQNITIQLSIGIVLFLFNQKISKFLSNRCLNV